MNLLVVGRQHWREYLIEALGLGLFMLSACLFVSLLEHPNSPIRQAVADPFLRRIPMGLAMGLTAIATFTRPGDNGQAPISIPPSR
jgi:aquaporin Z